VDASPGSRHPTRSTHRSDGAERHNTFDEDERKYWVENGGPDFYEHIDGTELYSDDSLEQLSRRFDAQQFLRVHRGAIINLAFLRELVHEGDRHYVAVLADRGATRIAVSRERLPALKSALVLK
jgi:two-component system, LytTR family, response regulator